VPPLLESRKPQKRRDAPDNLFHRLRRGHDANNLPWPRGTARGESGPRIETPFPAALGSNGGMGHAPQMSPALPEASRPWAAALHGAGRCARRSAT
jgi:hypothetical protein